MKERIADLFRALADKLCPLPDPNCLNTHSLDSEIKPMEYEIVEIKQKYVTKKADLYYRMYALENKLVPIDHFKREIERGLSLKITQEIRNKGVIQFDTEMDYCTGDEITTGTLLIAIKKNIRNI